MDHFIAYWHTLTGKLVLLAGLSVLLVLGVLLARVRFLYRCRQRLRDYREFLWTHYVQYGEPVPGILSQRYFREIERYRKACGHGLFRRRRKFSPIPTLSSAIPFSLRKEVEV